MNDTVGTFIGGLAAGSLVTAGGFILKNKLGEKSPKELQEEMLGNEAEEEEVVDVEEDRNEADISE